MFAIIEKGTNNLPGSCALPLGDLLLRAACGSLVQAPISEMMGLYVSRLREQDNAKWLDSSRSEHDIGLMPDAQVSQLCIRGRDRLWDHKEQAVCRSADKLFRRCINFRSFSNK